MSILRSGASKKYSDGWERAFGKKSKKKTAAKTTSAKKTSASKKKKSKR